MRMQCFFCTELTNQHVYAGFTRFGIVGLPVPPRGSGGQSQREAMLQCGRASQECYCDTRHRQYFGQIWWPLITWRSSFRPLMHSVTYRNCQS